ncbi:glutamine synthetase family protein [Pseudomonas sp. KU43P]|uniref:glutamine synthetase family protein n=1 Tax=Pseudomonas sp. KU43P TaxID=2487887 RepID=UPI0012A8FA51|nr:glutamine synthetase family protein [Pseudomonas sp. KU43P]BBH45763.1 glutamine synthetase [Pseudomonas sp. KU43P]
MTALDLHRELNTSSQKSQDLANKIKASGVEYLYYQVVTLSGRVIAKVVPAKHLIRNLEKGVQFHRTAISDLQTSRTGELLGGGANAAEFTAIPDIDSFNVLPWDRTIGSFYCRLYEPDHRVGNGGEPLATDARGHLIRSHEAFIKETGLRMKSGCEPEMTWFGDKLEVHVRPGASPAYHLGNLELMRPIFKKVMEYAQAMGLDMIEGDYEDPGQLELNWMFDSCELTADRLMTYRLICRQVASEFGVKASFMPKPSTGSMGNGCHHNVSLWRGNENVLAEPGRRELHLTETGLHALGGMLAHAPGSMMIMASTVNSYKRFWDIGQFAPNRINWGMDNKTCTVRLSANGRLEYKLPDASVNPYLSHTVLLAGMLDGLRNKIDPGASQSKDSYADDAKSVGIPLTLGEAVTAFDKDEIVQSAFPAELTRLYRELKADEWARSCGVVTDWERKMYLDYLP